MTEETKNVDKAITNASEKKARSQTDDYLMKTLLLMLALFVSSIAYAVPNHLPYNFHTESKMIHPKLGPIEMMYGYVDVNIDERGTGLIKVKFSNGRHLDGARFNADVKFIGMGGGIVATEHFDSGIGAAGFHGAVERDHKRQVPTLGFDRVEVDFYLDNLDNFNVSVPIYTHDPHDRFIVR